MGITVSIGGSGKADVTVYGRGTVIAGNGNDSINITGGGKIIVGSGHDTLTLNDGGQIWQHGSSGVDTINLGSGKFTLSEQGQATVTGAFYQATVIGGVLQIGSQGGQGHHDGWSGGDHGGRDDGDAGRTGFSGHDAGHAGFWGHDGGHAQGDAASGGASRCDDGNDHDHGHGYGGHGSGDQGYGGGGATNVVTAVSGYATLQGGTANMEFVGGSGWTVMRGGITGNDTFVGGSGHDTMIGGGGQNVFDFVSGEAGGQHVISNFVSGQDQLNIEGSSLAMLQSAHDISTSGGNTFITIDGGKTTIELQGVTGLKISDFTHH